MNKPDLTTAHGVLEWAYGATQSRILRQTVEANQTAAYLARAVRIARHCDGVGEDMGDWGVDDYCSNVWDLCSIMKGGAK